MKTLYTITVGAVTLCVVMAPSPEPKYGPVYRYRLALENGAVLYRFRGRGHLVNYLRGMRENPDARVGVVR